MKPNMRVIRSYQCVLCLLVGLGCYFNSNCKLARINFPKFHLPCLGLDDPNVFCMYNLKTVWQSLLKAQWVLFQFSCRCRKLRTIFCYTLAVGHFKDYKKIHLESIEVYLHRDLGEYCRVDQKQPSCCVSGPALSSCWGAATIHSALAANHWFNSHQSFILFDSASRAKPSGELRCHI